MKSIPAGIRADLMNARTTPQLPVALPTLAPQPVFTEKVVSSGNVVGPDLAQPTVTLWPTDPGKASINDSN